jgi:[pyruvate, water dikinase]-phosphate phosphotransferase / [pyruvate, water dikinase] kinase
VETKTTVYVISDSIGETGEKMARAAISQFENDKIDVVRVPFVRTPEQIRDIVQEAVRTGGIICHTLVSLDLCESLDRYAAKHGVRYVDLMGPMLAALSDVTGDRPAMKPGIIHKLDEEYFRKVEAVEFAVMYDDGKNPAGFLKADIVLIGVSRTSKTPMSMYLANKRYKVANLPLVPEVRLPEEIFKVPAHRIIGLIIDPYKLNSIRNERMKALGFAGDANYTSIDRIEEELAYAKSVMRKLHCPILDVSNRAIEETAARIVEIIEKNKSLYGEKY